MQFEPNETQQLIVRSAREFAEKNIMPVAAELDRSERFPADILAGLAELGMMGVNLPTQWGGAEAGVGRLASWATTGFAS